MKKIALIFGSISGALVSSMFIITYPLMKNGTLRMEHSEIVGYSTMVIALSMIFFGVKSYRDRHVNGIITFGKAFQVGLSIAVVAALFYAITWEFYYHNFIPNFIDEYSEMCVTRAKAEGADEAEIQKVMAQVETTREIYKSPILRFGMTLMEIFPVGLVIALISAAILRKKQILPA